MEVGEGRTRESALARYDGAQRIGRDDLADGAEEVCSDLDDGASGADLQLEIIDQVEEAGRHHADPHLELWRQ